MAGRRERVNTEANKTCDSCEKSQAVLSCFCTGARTYLCRGCIGDHTIKYPDLFHQLIRTDIEVSDLLAYRERSEAFAAGTVELKQNLTRIDQCCQDVKAAFNAVIESLQQWRDHNVSLLQGWKTALNSEIMKAENEVKSSLEQDNVQLKCKYSPLLRHYKHGPLVLFTCEINTSSYNNLAQNVVKFQFMEDPKNGSFGGQMQTQESASPSLQPVQENTVDTTHQDLQGSEQEANQLLTLAISKTESGNYAEAIELHAAADAIYSRLFPDNINTANNLYNWGIALKRMRKSAEAATKYAAADAIYSRLFPDHINTANNLYNWGTALNNMGKSAEAVAKYAAADTIYARLFPEHINTANNFNNWGIVLSNMGKSAEAVIKYAAADAIYARLFPDHINTAGNLNNWGIALKKMGKSEEAVTKYAAADATYARFFPDHINTANNLHNWGIALDSMGKNVEAVAKYAAADATYTRLFPEHINTANNLYNWGTVLKKMGNSAEAVRRFEAARLIYSLKGSAEDVRDCDQRLTSLK